MNELCRMICAGILRCTGAQQVTAAAAANVAGRHHLHSAPSDRAVWRLHPCEPALRCSTGTVLTPSIEPRLLCQPSPFIACEAPHHFGALLWHSLHALLLPTGC